MNYFCDAAAFMAFVAFSGLGLTVICVRRTSWAIAILVAPWVGYCYLIFAAWNVYYFGGVISRIWLVTFSLVPLLCLFFAFYRRRPFHAFASSRRGPLAAFCLAAISFAVISYSIIGANVGPTAVSLGNHDVLLYAAISRYLIEFSRATAEGFTRLLVLTMDYNYFGAPAFTAVASVFLGVMPHQVSSLCTNLFLPLAACGAWLLLRDNLGHEPKVALIGLALVAFHPILIYIVLQGFCSQTAGIGLSVMIFWAWAHSFKISGWQRYRSGYFALLSIFTLGLFLTYQHMLPFVWFFIGVYSVTLALPTGFARAACECINSICTNLAAFLVAVTVCPERLLALYSTLRGTGGSPGGWFLPFITPDYVLGLVYTNIYFTARSWQSWLPASAVVILLVTAFCCIAYRRGNHSTVSLTVACASIFVGSLILAISDRHLDVIGGYRSFKLTAFFLPFFCVVAATFFAFDLFRSKLLSISLRIIALGTLFHAELIADAGLLKTIVRNGVRVEPRSTDLLQVDYDPRIESINLLGTNWWFVMSDAYFLMHKKLSFETSTYYPATDLSGTYDLWDSEDITSLVQSAGILRVHPPIGSIPNANDGSRIRVGSRFQLVAHGSAESILDARMGSGWWGNEGSHIWAGRTNRRCTILLRSTKDVNVQVTFSYAASTPGDRMTFDYEGLRLLGPISSGPNDVRHLDVPDLKLHKGNNEVFLTSEFEPRQPSPSDPRTLSCAFRAIDIKIIGDRAE